MDQPTPSDLLTSQQELSPLEQEVLDEYERLAENMKKVFLSPTTRSQRRLMIANKLAEMLDDLASRPTTEILDGLRELERKTSLVFTLLKASVYSIVLQQEMEGQ
jgi:DASH complex subunit DAD3